MNVDMKTYVMYWDGGDRRCWGILLIKMANAKVLMKEGKGIRPEGKLCPDCDRP